MFGIHITSQQESIYMKERTQKLSAAKSGISISSGYRTEKGLRQPKKPRTHRTRVDPLSDIWKSELLPLLHNEPTLSGLTLWEHLDAGKWCGHPLYPNDARPLEFKYHTDLYPSQYQ